MYRLLQKSVKFLTVFSIIVNSFAYISTAQVTEKKAGEVEVRVLQESGSRYFGCRVENGVIDEESFKKLKAGALHENCLALEQKLKVDFAKHTLIGYSVRGDCFVRATAKIFRNDSAKKYTVRVLKIWGGCRAAGVFQGWLVIDKIRSDYAVDFVETTIDERDEFKSLKVTPEKPSLPEPLETRPIDLKGCIQIIFTKQFVIKDEKTYLKMIRSDASRDWCLKNLEKIDFGKHTLLGVEINSGYCRIPVGLKYQAVKDAATKQYLLSISYIDPGYETCRALSQFDLWVLIPKAEEDYEIVFNVKARPGEKEQ